MSGLVQADDILTLNQVLNIQLSHLSHVLVHQLLVIYAGKYKGAPIKLHIYESIRPLKRDIEEHHFIFASNNVERELNKCLEQEIIERIEGTPTSWVIEINQHVY
jgi:hypothetical protein